MLKPRYLPDINILVALLAENHIHRQIPDLHLLALAIKHDMRLVTLDRRIDYKLVKNAKLDDIILLQ